MCIVFIAVVLVIAILLLTKITINIDIRKKSEKPFCASYEIKAASFPIKLKKKAGKSDKSSADTDGESDKQGEKEEDPILVKISRLRTNIARGKYTYLLSKRYVKRKIHITSLDLSVTFGLGDAAETGIVTGALWGGIYGVFGFLDSLFTVHSHNFKVNPVFEDECLEVEFYATAKMRVVNILALVFAVWTNYLKTGKNL